MLLPTISLIIPIYNTGAYLQRCLDSVVAQREVSSGDVEVLLVDDCSTDSSAETAELYCRRFKTVELIRQSSNQGVSAARNRGIDCAHGRYLMFLDSDDEIAGGAFAKILSVIRDVAPDYVKFMHVRVDENGRELDRKTTSASGLFDVVKGGARARQAVFDNVILNMMCWNGVYRREIVGDIRFDSAYPISEDSYFALLCAVKSSRFYIVDEPLCHYYTRTDSLSKKVSKKAILGLLELIRRYGDACSSADWLNTVRTDVVRRLFFFMLEWDYVLVFKSGEIDAELETKYFDALDSLCRRAGAVKGMNVLYPIVRLAIWFKSGKCVGACRFYCRTKRRVVRKLSLLLKRGKAERFAIA